MKRKLYIKISIILVILTAVIFILYQSKDLKNEKEEISQSVSEAQVSENPEPEEKNQGEEEQSNENISAEEEKALEEEMKREKIELMDYADLPIEEFMEKTGLVLQRRENNLWVTEDEDIWVKTDHGKIIHMDIGKLLYDSESGEFSIDEEWFPYTLAGISPNDNRMDLENGVLKDGSAVYEGMGYYYYSSLSLAKTGIEKLTLMTLDEKGAIHTLYADLDMSLKENAEGLQYIWKEEEMKKSGACNDELTETDGTYTEIVDRYNESGKIDKTGVWITYPYLEIAGNEEMTQNANAVISEAIEKVEERAYRNSDENVILRVEYMMNYVSSKLISITFIAHVTSNSKKERFWQRCNISIAQNGEKAYLADLGFTKENIAEACSTAGVDAADIDAYLDDFDTNWDQYDIEPMKYYLFVPALEEDIGLPDGKHVVHVWKNEEFLSQ